MYIPTLSAHPAPAIDQRLPKMQPHPCRSFCVCKEDRLGGTGGPTPAEPGCWKDAGWLGPRESGPDTDGIGAYAGVEGCDAVPERNRHLPGGPAPNLAPTDSPLLRVA